MYKYEEFKDEEFIAITKEFDEKLDNLIDDFSLDKEHILEVYLTVAILNGLTREATKINSFIYRKQKRSHAISSLAKIFQDMVNFTHAIYDAIEGEPKN